MRLRTASTERAPTGAAQRGGELGGADLLARADDLPVAGIERREPLGVARGAQARDGGQRPTAPSRSGASSPASRSSASACSAAAGAIDTPVERFVACSSQSTPRVEPQAQALVARRAVRGEDLDRGGAGARGDEARGARAHGGERVRVGGGVARVVVVVGRRAEQAGAVRGRHDVDALGVGQGRREDDRAQAAPELAVEQHVLALARPDRVRLAARERAHRAGCGARRVDDEPRAQDAVPA